MTSCSIRSRLRLGVGSSSNVRCSLELRQLDIAASNGHKSQLGRALLWVCAAL